MIENLYFHNSPYWTIYSKITEGLEIRNIQINNRRNPDADSHSLIELSAFNTDGIDVEGNNIWIHDVDIWAQDDTIAVKKGTNMLFERINASGIGLTIGSVGNDAV